MLPDNKRQQLDSIVSQMTQNRETEDTIQFVVNDFKNKYSVEEPKESFLEKTANVFDMFFGGKKIGEAIGTQIAKLTVPEEQKQFVAPGPSIKEIAGSALQSAALFTPIGKIAKGITLGTRGLGLVRGASALGKISSGVLAGELFDVASNLQQGKTGKEALTPGFGALLGGVIPSAEVAKNVVVRFGQGQAPRIINSLIKPLAKDFSYGKNPGRAVAEEGIIANNFDDLVTNIRTTRQTIGKAIGELSDNLSQQPVLNIQEALNPLDDALKVAASQNNVTLLNRLNNVKRAITDVLEPVMDDTGNLTIQSIGKRSLDNLTFKQTRNILSDIGDMTQFTGNPSDDKLVNSALKGVYGKIKETTLKYAENINPELAKEFSKLTEKYADLHSAEIAAKYRDKILERQNLIGLSPTTVGIGSALITAVATGGATIPSLLAGATGAVIDKLASTPGFKTRLAYMLSKKTQREASYLFRKIPALSKFFSTEGGIFPGDILIGDNGEVISRKISEFIQKPKIGLAIEDISKQVYKGEKDLTTKFLEYAKGKTTLSKQEIVDFARRPELKKGEADLLNRLGNEVKETKIPAQEFADSIRRDLLELKPVKVKEPEYEGTTLAGRVSHPGESKNYEEVIFESPITTNGSSHYPNSKNYFAHARGDEVIEGGKKIWREQEIQSDVLQKEGLENLSTSYSKEYSDALQEAHSRGFKGTEASDFAKKWVAEEKELIKLQPFTNDRFGERIMRERIKEKAQKGYEKYRLPTGETIGKIEGFEENVFRYPKTGKKVTADDLEIGQNIEGQGGQSWIITDILGDGRFKAVPKSKFDFIRQEAIDRGVKVPTEKELTDDFIKSGSQSETFDLTGKSNPQYRRYQDWGKFLKNRFGGKEVIDPQGNSWIEIDLKPEYKRIPIEAFGIGALVTQQEEE